MINAYKYFMDDTLGGATITVTPQPVGIAACGMVTVAAPSVSYGCTWCLELSIGDQVWIDKPFVNTERITTLETGKAGLEPTILTTVKLRPRDAT